MHAVSLPTHLIHHYFQKIISAVYSDELNRRELVEYIKQIENTLLDEKMMLLCAALDDVERGDVVRLNTETPFDLPSADFNQLLNEALDDVKNGRVERYGI